MFHFRPRSPRPPCPSRPERGPSPSWTREREDHWDDVVGRLVLEPGNDTVCHRRHSSRRQLFSKIPTGEARGSTMKGTREEAGRRQTLVLLVIPPCLDCHWHYRPRWHPRGSKSNALAAIKDSDQQAESWAMAAMHRCFFPSSHPLHGAAVSSIGASGGAVPPTLHDGCAERVKE